jgi:hypothetical protein
MVPPGGGSNSSGAGGVSSHGRGILLTPAKQMPSAVACSTIVPDVPRPFHLPASRLDFQQLFVIEREVNRFPAPVCRNELFTCFLSHTLLPITLLIEGRDKHQTRVSRMSGDFHKEFTCQQCQ